MGSPRVCNQVRRRSDQNMVNLKNQESKVRTTIWSRSKRDGARSEIGEILGSDMWSPNDPPHGDPEGGNVSYGVGTCRGSMRSDSENRWESEKGNELELPMSIRVTAWNAIGNMCQKMRPCGERMR